MKTKNVWVLSCGLKNKTHDIVWCIIDHGKEVHTTSYNHVLNKTWDWCFVFIVGISFSTNLGKRNVLLIFLTNNINCRKSLKKCHHRLIRD